MFSIKSVEFLRFIVFTTSVFIEINQVEAI